MKKWLLGLTLEELSKVAENLSLPSFAAMQIAQWLYHKRVTDIEKMTNLSKESREKLLKEYEVGGYLPSMATTSVDGTVKYLFPSLCGTDIEAVMIPEKERLTLCLSSQAGCKMGCRFCMTGRMGFMGNLTAGEIISQIINVPQSESITNVVFMGMGEPLDNYNALFNTIEILTAPWGFGWSPKKITLSTIGLHANLEHFLENSKCHLAISLHHPNREKRVQLMPMEKAWPIEKSIEIIKRYNFSGQRRVSFEYIMFSGWNDSKKEADALIRMLKGLECRVNLIRFHKIPNFPLSPSPDVVMQNFRDRLNSFGITATIRASRGEDIMAACGMLSSKKVNNEGGSFK